VQIRLDRADLWVGRDADMFRARFGFRGLDLVQKLIAQPAIERFNKAIR